MTRPAARPDGIVFDLDGTLWDATDTVAAAWHTAVRAEYPRREPVTRAAIAAVMGLSHADLLERMFPDFDWPERERLAALCYAEEERLLRVKGGRLYPGVAEGLACLAERNPLFIVSNCQRGYIETFLDVTGLSAFFRDYECHGRTGLPKAENLADVARRNGLRSPWYVGDTEGDSAAAEGSGMPFVHAAYGFGSVHRATWRCESFPAVVEVCLGGRVETRSGEKGTPSTMLLERSKFPRPVDRAEVARAWRLRGFTCDLFVDPPGQEWNGYVHSVNELVTVLEGRLRFETGPTTHTMEPGDELFIPAGAVHSVKNVHAGPARWLYGYDS